MINLPSSPTAATISTNIEGNIACPGEVLVLTCTGQGPAQRWNIQSIDIEHVHTFTIGETPGTISVEDPYNFTLISVAFDSFESTLSTTITNEINNTVIECTDSLSHDTAVIRIAGLMMNSIFT